MRAIMKGSTAQPTRFNPSLNGYRGFCAIHVFLHHAGMAGLLPAPDLAGPDNAVGWPWSVLRYGGPEMFFMISGFLILASLRRAVSLRSFLRDRFIRIYCAWLPVLIALTLVLRAFNMKALADTTPSQALGIFAANLLLLPPLLPIPAVHVGSWTLTFEWLFYLLAALGMALLRPARSPRWTIATWIFACVMTVWLLPSTMFFLTGVVVLLKADWFERHRAWLRFPLFSFVIYLIAWRYTDAYKSEVYVNFFEWIRDHRAIGAVIAFLASLHVFACIAFDTSAELAFLKTRVMQFLGNVSYSLYLWHLLIMGVIKRLVATHVIPSHGATVGFAVFFAASLAVTLVVAWASFTLLEVRLVHWVRRAWGPRAPQAQAGPVGVQDRRVH
jgi:peptidoglycan/LPS O-acetylase OafA/YrhL